MGAMINHDDFQSIDLLRELEKARFDLHKKIYNTSKQYYCGP